MEQVISRRHLLASASAIPLTVALSACGAGTTPAAISAIAAAVFSAIAQEVQLVLPQLEQAGLDLGKVPQVQQWLAAIQQAAAAISSASTQSQGASALTVIEQDANSLAPIVEAIAPLVPGGSIIGLVFAALPEIEILVNFGASLLQQSVAQVAKTAPPANVGFRMGAAGPDVTRINQLIAAARR